MNRKLFALMALVTGLAAVAAPSSASAATVQCATVGNERWCNVVSTQYPNTKGWYGYVGLGGGPCNSNPKGTSFPDGMAGICLAPAPIKVYKYTANGWQTAYLNDGVRGYVHPWDSTWRWLYSGGSWYAIQATQLTLEWRA